MTYLPACYCSHRQQYLLQQQHLPQQHLLQLDLPTYYFYRQQHLSPNSFYSCCPRYPRTAFNERQRPKVA